MLSVSVTADWRAAHPGAAIGLLEIAGVNNTRSSSALDQRKRETEARLRERYQGFARPDLLALPVMAAYARYYKRFGKTYHVLLQVESLVLKGKSLPQVSPLVDANFTAEVETLVLTAGHDVEHLHGEVSLGVAREGDQLAPMTGGAPKAIPPGDMIMRDAQGVCCSIIYGQDHRSPISPATSHALYVAYAPAGVPHETVDTHLRLIEAHARLVSPSAVTESLRVLVA